VIDRLPQVASKVSEECCCVCEGELGRKCISLSVCVCMCVKEGGSVVCKREGGREGVEGVLMVMDILTSLSLFSCHSSIFSLSLYLSFSFFLSSLIISLSLT
jgi:hypothetical protein